MNRTRVMHFVEIIEKIPIDTWTKILKMEPEWQYLGSYYHKYTYGLFTVLMAAVGLNSYQLKGKADKVYWPAIKNHLDSNSLINSKQELKETLISFYEKERLPKGKIKRLNKFFSSSLVDELLKSNPQYVSENFQDIWKKLAFVMKQKENDKTICFAMKCLGISIIYSNHLKIDFSCIPIPVDSRVRIFTKKIKLIQEFSYDNIQYVWNNILHSLQKTHPSLNMIHLDSLIWQIGNLNEEELMSYFHSIHLPCMVNEILQLFDDS
jgi:DNA-(apurinic or apyrimidinic site) lyase